MPINDQIRKLLSGYIVVGKELEIDKIPEWQRELIKKVLVPQLNGVPISAILQGLNAKTSQILLVKKPMVKIDKITKVLVNYYGLTFMPSGAGKNKLVRILENSLFAHAIEDFYNRVKKWKDKEWDRIKIEAEELQTKAAQDSYIEKHEPRFLSRQSSDGTIEGFMADRLSFYQAGWGGTFFQNSEFLDFLLSKNNSRDQLLTLLAEIYDNGDDDGKTIKSLKNNIPVRSVPSSALVFSSISGMHDEGSYQLILNRLNKQLARRAFICYPNDDEYEYKEFDTVESRLEYINNIDTKVMEGALKRFLYTINTLEENHTFSFNKESSMIYHAYSIFCENNSRTINAYVYDGLRSEAMGRSWKAVKLAGIIQAIKTPDKNILSPESMLEAIYQTEYFGKYYEKFYEDNPPTDAEKLFDYFNNNMNIWIATNEIRQQNFVNKNRFKRWFEESISMVEEISLKKGLLFEYQKFGKSGKQYMLREV